MNRPFQTVTIETSKPQSRAADNNDDPFKRCADLCWRMLGAKPTFSLLTQLTDAKTHINARHKYYI